jgi:fucose permease
VAPIPVLAPSLVTLVLGMLVFGALNGVLDVSMNAHGVALEKRLGRPMISSLHAGWSLGGLLGAAAVALAAAVGVDPRTEVFLAAGALLVLAAVAIPRLGTGSQGAADVDAGGGGSRFTLPSRAVLPIGLLAVVAALVEGGIGDWFGLYLQRDLGLETGLAALGFAAFAGGMTVGRLSGDALNRRFGAGLLLRGGMALVALALGLTIALGQPALALVGVAIAGVGVANAIPIVFSAGGHIQPSGPSLAAVFTMTYTAFLAAPPILGFIADAIGLAQTLSLLVVIAAFTALVATRVPGIEAANRLQAVEAGSAIPAPASR